MKYLTAIFLTILLASLALFGVSAQAADTIWMETEKDAFGPGETITVTLKANSKTPIQGFNFKLRYDPNCLQPDVPTSLVSGLNYMTVPQISGMINGIFASTNKVNANGSLVKIDFKAIANCQTSVTLEKANLAVPNEARTAVSLPGISLGTSNLMLSVSAGNGSTAAQSPGTPAAPSDQQGNPILALPTVAAPEPTASSFLSRMILPIAIICGLILLAGVIIAVLPIMRKRKVTATSATGNIQAAVLLIQRGPQAGTSLPLTTSPCRIGSGPDNEIRLNDPRIAINHAEILADSQGFTLVDLGTPEGTNLNGVLIRNQQSPLKFGDVLRLGGVLLVFSPA
ncbi:MAG: FHA domain-containing protein [Chloroflexota bacterium]